MCRDCRGTSLLNVCTANRQFLRQRRRFFNAEIAEIAEKQ
jgi:hypothetical protein